MNFVVLASPDRGPPGSGRGGGAGSLRPVLPGGVVLCQTDMIQAKTYMNKNTLKTDLAFFSKFV